MVNVPVTALLVTLMTSLVSVWAMVANTVPVALFTKSALRPMTLKLPVPAVEITSLLVKSLCNCRVMAALLVMVVVAPVAPSSSSHTSTLPVAVLVMSPSKLVTLNEPTPEVLSKLPSISASALTLAVLPMTSLIVVLFVPVSMLTVSTAEILTVPDTKCVPSV